MCTHVIVLPVAVAWLAVVGGCAPDAAAHAGDSEPARRLVGEWDARFRGTILPLGGAPDARAADVRGAVALLPNHRLEDVPGLATPTNVGTFDVDFTPLGFDVRDPARAPTAVARAVLEADRLRDVTVIYRQTPKVNGAGHFGSRLVFAKDGTLFVTLGDRQGYRERAQDLSTTLGKVVRITTDGTVPPDNPFVGRDGARPEIWSYGHRNPQGATLVQETGQLWTVEHGARGGDELNHPEAGRNYGWPVITYGRDYSGATIGVGTSKDGMEQPVFYWDPSIAPSGLAWYTGDRFPMWKGSFIVGALNGTGIAVLKPDKSGGMQQVRYVSGISRRRQVTLVCRKAHRSHAANAFLQCAQEKAG